MNKPILKNRQKLHKLIMILLVVSCVLFTVASTLIIYFNTKESLSAKSEVQMINLMASLKQYLPDGSESETDGIGEGYLCNQIISYINDVNFLYDQENLDDSNVYVNAESGKNFVAGTGNYLSVAFGDYQNIANSNYIDFDTFRASMTDDQYYNILNTLSRKPENGEGRYALVCTQYYEVPYKGILPKQLQVVKVLYESDWYVMNEVEATYELSPKNTDDDILFTIGEMHRNEIDKDFFCNEKRKNITAEEVNSVIPDGYYMMQGVKHLSGFDYIMVNMDNFEKSKVIFTKQGEDTITNNYNKLYKATCAIKFNVLSECIGSIIIALIIILFFFGIIGALEMAMWRISKTKALQEQSRIEMTNAVAHNLKTPLFVISGFAENLKGEADRDKKFHYIEVIQQQTKEMNSLVHRMIDFSKLDSPQMNLHLEKFNLTSFVSEMLLDYRLCSENEIILNAENDVEITADKSVLKMAVENLIDNAIKYSTLYDDIVVEISKGYFGISNRCKPLSNETLERLWTPYYRQTDGDNTSGNGLGLSIVKSAFELHKFKYGADYSNGKICFWFLF